LAIGTEAKPHTRKATITLTDNVKGEEVMVGMGAGTLLLRTAIGQVRRACSFTLQQTSTHLRAAASAGRDRHPGSGNFVMHNRVHGASVRGDCPDELLR
jgi:hypothetical protein